MNARHRRFLLAAVLVASLPAPAIGAEELDACEQPHEVSASQLLRRLSLDLRGRIPSIEEYEQLTAVGVPAPLVRDWLGSAEFGAAMRRYHEVLLWPNISNVRLNGLNAELVRREGEPALHLAAGSRLRTHRGRGDAVCLDVEQTAFDPAFPGEFRPHTDSLHVDEDGTRHEGWRLIAPYWDPANPVKVCAFDAQEAAEVDVRGVPIRCNSASSQASPACGCGPDLRFCFGPDDVTSKPVLASLRAQLGKSVDDVTIGGRPYTDLVLSTKAWQDGRIAFWKKGPGPHANYSQTYNEEDPDEELEDRAFTDTTWTQVDRRGLHAGVLTLPAYLLRFQTNRGRANRFRSGFLCESFVPPERLTDAPPACAPSGTDLVQRCHCRACHQTLEPLAAAWGSFVEAGTTLLTDRTRFPIQMPSCASTEPSGPCLRFYVTQPDAHAAGTLLGRQWEDTYPALTAEIDGGPRLLAQRMISSGQFARCATRRAFEHFIRREMRVAGEKSDEAALLEALAEGFVASGYSFPKLVESIVSLPQYRTTR